MVFKILKYRQVYIKWFMWRSDYKIPLNNILVYISYYCWAVINIKLWSKQIIIHRLRLCKLLRFLFTKTILIYRKAINLNNMLILIFSFSVWYTYYNYYIYITMFLFLKPTQFLLFVPIQIIRTSLIIKKKKFNLIYFKIMNLSI